MRNDTYSTQKSLPDSPPRSLGRAIRVRIIEGLLLTLPVAITYGIIRWLYTTLNNWVISPVSDGIVELAKRSPVEDFVASLPSFLAPISAVVIILVFLYVLGMFLHSRLHKAMDWVLLKVPVVTTIYAAVRNVFNSLASQRGGRQFKRVVLVPFPHPGMKVPAFVTSTCRDKHTGKTILCVYVPTTPVPTSGYMLMIPEEDVTELDWDINDTLQAIISGGISAPSDVTYFAAPAGPSEDV